jgi:hypothetical protein
LVKHRPAKRNLSALQLVQSSAASPLELIPVSHVPPPEVTWPQLRWQLCVGATVGADVVGFAVGLIVGLAVGLGVGAGVGSEVVGDADGDCVKQRRPYCWVRVSSTRFPGHDS